MDAVILCGGKGTRLASVLPPSLPKCMARVDGEPFIDVFLRHLRKQRTFSTFIFCTGYRAEVLEAHLSNTFWDGEADISTRLYFSREPEQMGTGYAILNAARAGYVATNPFFVFNGDTFCDTDYWAIFTAHLDAERPATVALGMDGTPVGVFMLGREMFKIMEGIIPPFSLEDALGRAEVATVSTAGRYYDIGTPEGLSAFREFYGVIVHRGATLAG